MAPKRRDTNPDLIDDGHHRFVLVEITKVDRDWRVLERFHKQPELTEHLQGVKEVRGAMRIVQQDMARQLRYVVSPRLKQKLQGWIDDIEQALRLK